MNPASARIQKDLIECYSYHNPDSPPIFVKNRDDKLEAIDCLIVGPPDTPYEFAFFQFEVRFPSTYPNAPPKCVITTTDNNKTRMNPNLYATGKVCLSILGTWTGESADEWRSTYSLLYILQAIQSLIMTTKPYHNEPGYEQLDSEYAKPEEVDLYTDKIQHETLRVAVCGTLEECLKDNSNPFRATIKNQFLIWYYYYLKRAQEQLSKNEGDFPMMPFEYPENCASGKYDYKSIIDRLTSIKQQLDQETDQWKTEGKVLTAAASGWRYLKLKDEYEIVKRGNILEGVSAGPLSPDNLYYFTCSIFGPDGSIWEGGIYNIEIVFGGDEETPPRVKFTTEMFHPHVNKDGVPFLTIVGKNKELLQNVIKSIFGLLKGRINSSPTTWANPEAAKLYFDHNDPELQKEYKRRVARCVRMSVE